MSAVAFIPEVLTTSQQAQAYLSAVEPQEISPELSNAIMTEGLSRMSDIFKAMLKANPKLGAVSFKNPNGGTVMYSLGGVCRG